MSPSTRAHLRAGRARFPTPVLALLLLALLATSARGAVEGSPHDLIAQGYDVVKDSQLQERCSRCHIPAASGLQNILPAVPPILAAAYSPSSLVCFSCHDGTTIVAPVVDASWTAFHPSSHGSDLAGYEGLVGEAAGLPFQGQRMECVTCHDTHNNGHRPLLRIGLGEICQVCHSTRREFGLGAQNTTGNHPQGANPATLARKEVPIKLTPPFATAFPVDYPLSGGRASVGTHWDLGGHLSLGGAGTIGCVTCHAVHGDEQNPPLPALLAVDPVLDVADLFCEGCHAGVRGDGGNSIAQPNPGGTSTGRTYHPVDDDASNNEGRALNVAVPKDWPLGEGNPRRLVCSTCHLAHGAQPQTTILRPSASAAVFCDNCHGQEQIANHHPLVLQGPCRQQLPPLEGEGQGRLSCARCHRAHNAGLGSLNESRFVPLLTEDVLRGCLKCHPAENPTCEKRPRYRASHFIGDPTVQETYNDTKPPLRRSLWPESKLPSLYDGEKEQDLGCLSCHTFRAGAVVSGDRGTQRFLLARSGNTQEWNPGEEDRYLCLGCHGVKPGTGSRSGGHSHPLMTAATEKLKTPPIAPITPTPNGHVNCDSCHRPHGADTRGGVYIMEVIDGLNEDPLAVQPLIDFTVVCRHCHDRLDY